MRFHGIIEISKRRQNPVIEDTLRDGLHIQRDGNSERGELNRHVRPRSKASWSNGLIDRDANVSPILRVIAHAIQQTSEPRVLQGLMHCRAEASSGTSGQ